MRIAFYISLAVVCLLFKPHITYAQVPREVTPIEPRDIRPEIMPNSTTPLPSNRLRIPEQFFRHDQFPHDRLPEDLKSGEIKPLTEIRKAVRSQYPGRIVDVRMLIPKREGINILYDVRVLTQSGKVLSVKVDAKSAQIIDVKG